MSNNLTRIKIKRKRNHVSRYVLSFNVYEVLNYITLNLGDVRTKNDTTYIILEVKIIP